MDSSLEDHKESKKGKSVSCKLKKKDFLHIGVKFFNSKIDLNVCNGHLSVFVFSLVTGI